MAKRREREQEGRRERKTKERSNGEKKRWRGKKREEKKQSGRRILRQLNGMGGLVSRNWCQTKLPGVVTTPTLHFVYSSSGERGLLVHGDMTACNRYHLPLLSRGDKTTKTVKAVIVKCLHWQIALYRSNLEERWTQFLQHWVSLHLAFFFIYTSSFVKQVQVSFYFKLHKTHVNVCLNLIGSVAVCHSVCFMHSYPSE